MAAWCHGNDFEIAGVFVETMSGGKMDNRPSLQAALSLACKLRGVLVCYSLSRISRSVRDTISIVEKLDHAGGSLASLSERLDFGSSHGQLVFTILSSMNQFERAQLSERTAGAMAYLRRSNRRISAKIPFGYDLAADGQTLTNNDREQAAIAEMVTMRAQGESLASIADRMTADGISTKEGKKWYPATVRAILLRNKKLAA